MDTNKLTELFSQALGMDCMIVDGDSDSFPYKLEFQSQLSMDEFLKFADECKEFLSQYGIETGAIIVINPEESTKTFSIQIIKSPTTEELTEKFHALDKAMQRYEMAKKGDLEGLKKLLNEESIEVNTPNINGETLLFPAALLAVYTNNFSIMEFLLENRANINHRDNGDATVLHVVIGQYCEETRDSIFIAPVVEELLDKGADVIIKTKQDETPLQVANRLGASNEGEMLINASLKIDPTQEKPDFLSSGLSNYWDEQAKKLADKAMTQAVLVGACGGTEVTSEAKTSQVVKQLINFFSPATTLQAGNSIVEQAKVKLGVANLGK